MRDWAINTLPPCGLMARWGTMLTRSHSTCQTLQVTQCKDSGVPALRSFAQQPPQQERGSPGTESCGVLMRARTGILPPILWRMWQAQHETGLQELLLSDAEAAQVCNVQRASELKASSVQAA